MIIKPVITEKSTRMEEKGKYTFIVPVHWNKKDIRENISKAFDVHVKKVFTMRKKGGQKKLVSGKVKKIRETKKAVVTLADKEKIALFEQSTKNRT
jgi:large subunit ribosomal protein L23